MTARFFEAIRELTPEELEAFRKRNKVLAELFKQMWTEVLEMAITKCAMHEQISAEHIKENGNISLSAKDMADLTFTMASDMVDKLGKDIVKSNPEMFPKLYPNVDSIRTPTKGEIRKNWKLFQDMGYPLKEPTESDTPIEVKTSEDTTKDPPVKAFFLPKTKTTNNN